MDNASRCRLWRQRNPEQVKKSNAARRGRADHRDSSYLKRLIGWVKSRCNNQSWAAINYRDRGIQCRIDIYDLALVWIRDKAWLLDTPHLDREDPDGHYETGNIRFITRAENLARRRRTVEECVFLDENPQPATNDEPGNEG